MSLSPYLMMSLLQRAWCLHNHHKQLRAFADLRRRGLHNESVAETVDLPRRQDTLDDAERPSYRGTLGVMLKRC
jgi:hypothetical protein